MLTGAEVCNDIEEKHCLDLQGGLRYALHASQGGAVQQHCSCMWTEANLNFVPFAGSVFGMAPQGLCHVVIAWLVQQPLRQPVTTQSFYLSVTSIGISPMGQQKTDNVHIITPDSNVQRSCALSGHKSCCQRHIS